MGKWEVTWSERVCYRMEVEAADERDAVRVARLAIRDGEWGTETDFGGMDDVNAEPMAEVAP